MIFMALPTIKRLAADILGVGVKKIRFKVDQLEEISKAMMRKDVKDLIEKGHIVKLSPKKTKRKIDKNKKKRRGHGSKKGSKSDKKEKWMMKVRAQRKLLRFIVETNVLPKEHKRKIYLRIKGGMFRSKRAFLNYLKDAKLIPSDYEIPKEEYSKYGKKVKKAKKPKIQNPKAKTKKPKEVAERKNSKEAKSKEQPKKVKK